MTRPWERLDAVDTADGPLELRRRGDSDFLITIAGRVLMTSSATRSEVALARLGCAGLASKAKARVLVSGLGMGFTLRAALDVLARDAHVTVSELTPEVVTWCRGPMAGLTTGAVNDPRVTVCVEDVAKTLQRIATDRTAPRFDAIVLDMYVGPDVRVKDSDPLYGTGAVSTARAALSDGGRFAVWGENASPGFERNLGIAGFDFELHRAGKGGRSHYLYVATTKARTTKTRTTNAPTPATATPSRMRR